MFNRKIGTISWKIHTPYEGMFGKSGYEKEVTGTMYIDLTDAIAHKLLELKVYGGTELKPETYLDTVTVSGGCEQRNLPSGYTELTYLQGDATAYIQTPVAPTTNTGMKIMFEYGTAGGSGAIAGTFNGVAPRKDTFFVSTNSGTVDNSWAFIAQAGSTLTSTNSEAPVVGKTYTANINYKNSGTYGFEGFTQQSVGTNGVLSNKVLLFARLNIANNNITASNCKIKYVEFTEGTEVTHIYIPAKFNNTLGLYDKVTGAFLTNTNASGTFTAGADVVPTPDTPIDIVCNNGTIKVSPNLFNKNNLTRIYAYFSATGSDWNYVDTGYSVRIPCLPNTTYTARYNGNETQAVLSFASTKSDNIPTINTKLVPVTQSIRQNNPTINTPITITTDADDKWLIVAYNVAEPQNTDMANNLQIEVGSTATSYRPYGQIYTDGTQEVVTDSLGNTANAEMLLSVGDYKDTQEVISGGVTRNVGIKVLDGTEDWAKGGSYNQFYSTTAITDRDYSAGRLGCCTHFTMTSDSSKMTECGYYILGVQTQQINFSSVGLSATTVAEWKQWLADQYANGTPVIVIYLLATATTSTVTGQFLSKSPVTQTAGSISNLPIAITESEKTTPTPQQPLQINCNNGVIKVSPNLFDSTVFNTDVGTTVTPIHLQIPNGTYTMSTNFPPQSGQNPYTNVWVLAGKQTSGWDSAINGVSLGNPKTFTVTDGWYTVTYRSNQSSIPRNPKNYEWQIEQGSTATSYMAYGQIYVDGTTETVEITGKNLFDQSLFNTDVGTTITYTTYNIPNGTYTFSSPDFQLVQYTANVFVFAGRVTSGASTSTNGVTSTTPRTITITDGQYTVAYRNAYGRNPKDYNWQLELGSTATTYEPYYNGGTATAQPLYKVGTYQDVQSVIDGGVTRNVGIKVLDGTENWISAQTSNAFYVDNILDVDAVLNVACYCTHFTGVEGSTPIGNMSVEGSIKCGFTNAGKRIYIRYNGFSNKSELASYLTTQYQNGTPVIVVYPLATSTTETVAGQPMDIQKGDNRIEITQASMDDLELSAKYKSSQQ